MCFVIFLSELVASIERYVDESGINTMLVRNKVDCLQVANSVMQGVHYKPFSNRIKHPTIKMQNTEV